MIRQLTPTLLGDETVMVLDQVARLLFINHEMRARAEVFTLSQELDRDHAKPDAVAILEFTRDISTKLMDALFGKKRMRNTSLAAAYKQAAERIDDVHASAQRLSQEETQGLQSTLLENNVRQNLEHLGIFWKSVVSR